MSYIKNLTCFLLILFVSSFNGCSKQLKYVEGNIYSESDLTNYQNKNLEKKQEEFLTREEAIKYAQNVFEEGFNEKIIRDELREAINLSKNNGDFYWSINWKNIKNNIVISQYNIIINSNTKKVENAWVIIVNKEMEEYYNRGLDKEAEQEDLNSFIEIATPMMKKMNIDPSDYVVNGFYKGNRGILLLKSDTGYYEFVVDMDSKKLISFNT
ncbi:hypothetical protein ACH36K_09635 [Clostridium sp. MB05]|uniref:hypothetical protein n=1 Tax=Clostridium sp. MB05 TaxID=3376682 RepID=UPI003981ECF2